MLRLWCVQVIAPDVEKSIPTGAIIFKSDLPSQLHELFFRKLIAQTRIQIVGNIGWRVSQGVSQFNYEPLDVIKWRPVIAENSAQFVITQAGFSLPTAELMSIQNGQPMRRAVRTLPS
jgi:hypothetical protein